MNLTHEDVQEILQLLDGSPFDELYIETDRFKLTLRRTSRGNWTQENRTVAVPQALDASAAGKHETAAPEGTAAKSADESPAGARAGDPAVIEVRTPIVGTFYRAPKPGAAPFVELGAKVEPDTVVGIVETMKLMNSVYAGARGEVLEICAADGQFVEQGRLLMRLGRIGS